ncbi:hypothetical protein [Streptomyces halobius]|uniref:Integral membrane protein n=1 Tax=Streptomyces halobius TaxID=2879846 RepID=A0ABY4MLY6_9ACTN|nr:hypothetical protein [Streptomyces halobius]UQA98207.1 hypothetical protein K9S39_39340 [Streptomyces halobius]
MSEERKAAGKDVSGMLGLYGRGVRTALRDNATAYGFSISITAAYGLVTSTQGTAAAGETVMFALGSATAFLVVGLVFLTLFRHARLSEGEQELTLGGVIDVLSVAVAVSAAYGLSLVPGFAAWPLTGLGTVSAYLLAGGMDVVLARLTARHTSMGKPE